MSRFQDFIAQNQAKCRLVDLATKSRRAMCAADRLASQLDRGEIDAVYRRQEAALRSLLVKAQKTPYYREIGRASCRERV